MKTVMRRLARDEEGAALVVALILMLVGGLIAAPLLSHMGTGLVTGEVYESRTAELYAADAGVDDASWRILHAREAGLPGCGKQWIYTYPESDDPPFEVNSRDVEVSIQHLGAGAYKIISTATGNDSSTSITAYTALSFMDLSGILNYAISSNYAINITGTDTVVKGDVYIPDKANLDDPNNAINGTVYDSKDVSLDWPTFGQLHSYYWPGVMHLDPGDPAPVIYVKGSESKPYLLGPYLADVESLEALEIKGGGQWIRLEGTVYIKGSLYVDPSVNLDLNGHTIFATGTIKLSSSSKLYGSGCIIAKGNINFQPELSCEEGQYVLVLSLQGTTTLQPDSGFRGTVAGNMEVEIQPGNELRWVEWQGRGLDYPTGEGEYPVPGELSISSWEVTQP